MVLILVLVEHTLGELLLLLYGKWYNVLILVLVEHTLGAVFRGWKFYRFARLNPCFSGTYSRSI